MRGGEQTCLQGCEWRESESGEEKLAAESGGGRGCGGVPCERELIKVTFVDDA